MDPKLREVATVACVVLLVVAGPYGGAIGQEISSSTVEQPLSLDCDPTLSDRAPACVFERVGNSSTWRRSAGMDARAGPATATGRARSRRRMRSARLAEDPNDPLFLHDGLDDGVAGTSRITEHATVRIEIPLPPDVVLLDDPTRRSVILNRGTPTTMNTPGARSLR